MRECGHRGRDRARIRSRVLGILAGAALLIDLGCGNNLASMPNPSTLGQPVTFTDSIAGVNMPSGTVTFKEGSATLATVPLDASSQASFTTSTLAVGMHSIVANYSGDANNGPSSSNIVVQVVNAVAAATNYFTVGPCRLVDTRGPAGAYGAPALAANANRTFVAAGQCGIPSSVTAISANVTVTSPTGPGDLRVFAGGAGLPSASTINYRTNGTRANNAEIAIGTGGDFTVHVDQASGTVQVIVDVNGYFQ
jgi:hypothetical protein